METNKAVLPDTVNTYFNRYAQWTDETAKYPVNNEAHYLAMGATNEAAELVEKLYDADPPFNDEANPSKRVVDPALVRKEIGDVMWYLGRYCYRVLKVPFAEIIFDGELEFAGEEALSDFLFIPLGLLLGIEKKRIRDGAEWTLEETSKRNALAAGYVKRAVAQLGKLATYLEFTLQEACEDNQRKLSQRLEAGTIQGDGDNR